MVTAIREPARTQIEGLMQRLDYLHSLGVGAVWLAPFQPTPNRDNGYDISNFYGVDSRHGSSGDFGPAFITAIDVNTGKIAWQDRAFARAQLLYADGKLVILDEDGNLGLATATSEGLHVLAKAPILENRAWTPPTLVGTKLYARDRKNIAAFDLGG